MSAVLLLGLVLAQLFSTAIDAFDRGRAFYRGTTLQVAEEIANIAKSLDAVGPEARAQIVKSLSNRRLTVVLSRKPDFAKTVPERPYARAFEAILKRQLGPGWPVRVRVHHVRQRVTAGRAFFWDAPVNALDRYLTLRMFSLAPRGFAFAAQIALNDGSAVTFAAPLPYERITRLYVLLPKLFLMLAIVVAIMLLAVRWVTRPLKKMAQAAIALGQELNRSPLEESGPDEVRATARALNVMQMRLQEYVRDRAAMLAMLSHDLKTFITRLRLRAELLPESLHRDRLIGDLGDMVAMVNATLDYLHGAGADQHRAVFDVTALVESVRIDAEDMGWNVAVSGAVKAPFCGNAQELRRCLMNLVENAVKYGGEASISLEDRPGELTIAVSDPGPGVTPAEEERVFEPFYRGRSARSRESAGTGLGLNIARTIARAHGGDVVLEREGPLGCCFTVRLPRGFPAVPAKS